MHCSDTVCTHFLAATAVPFCYTNGMLMHVLLQALTCCFGKTPFGQELCCQMSSMLQVWSSSHCHYYYHGIGALNTPFPIPFPISHSLAHLFSQTWWASMTLLLLYATDHTFHVRASPDAKLCRKVPNVWSNILSFSIKRLFLLLIVCSGRCSRCPPDSLTEHRLTA